MPGPTLTPHTESFPWMEAYFDPANLVAGTVRLRVWRFSDNRTWQARGGWDITPGVAVLDTECPFRASATYRAEQFDASGVNLGWTSDTTATLDVSDVWVHDPLDPFNGINLGPNALLGGTGSTNAREVLGESARTEGSSVPKWIGSGRAGVDGMPVGFAVTSVGLMDELQAMIGGYDDPTRTGVLCIRTPPPARIPRTFFAVVRSDNEASRDVAWGGNRSDFTFTATEVAPPFPGLAVPLLRYGDLDAFGAYSAQDANWASYSLRDRAYELAGLAG